MHRKFHLRRLLARYEVTADPATAPATARTTPATPSEDGAHGNEEHDDELRAAGRKALEAERAANKASKKQIADLQAKLKEYEDRDKSEAEKTAERLAQLEKDTAASRSRADRLEVALDKGLPKTLADRLRGSTREELEADADELLKLVRMQKVNALEPDPSAGHGGGAKPTSLDEAIAGAYSNK